MLAQRLPALLVTHLPDVRWLCGFTGSNAALVVLAQEKRLSARLFTDGRYTAQAAQEVKNATIRIAKKSALTEAMVFAANASVQTCGFDAATTTVATLNAMHKALRHEAVRTSRSKGFLKPVNGMVSTLREVKDAAEIDALRRAAALGCELYEGMLGFIDVGMRELDVAAELEHRARLAGAEAMSFETIVAAGGPLKHATRACDSGNAAGREPADTRLRYHSRWILLRHDAHRISARRHRRNADGQGNEAREAAGAAAQGPGAAQGL